jgi:hypothetical protein
MKKIILFLIITLSIKGFGQTIYRINLEATSLYCGCSSLGGDGFYAYDINNNSIPKINLDTNSYPIVSFETTTKPYMVMQAGTCEPTGDDWCDPFPYSVSSRVIFDNTNSCEYKSSAEAYGLRANIQIIGDINNTGCVTSNLSCSGNIERWEVKKFGSNVYEIVSNSKVNTLTKTYSEIYSDNSGINKTTYFRAKFTGTQIYTYHPFIFTPCSPELDGAPITFKVKCNYESNGTAVFKLKTNIATSQKLLVTLYEGTAFRGNKFINYTDIENKVFTWNGFAPGTYTIKYQAQSNSDNSIVIGANPIISPSFTIEDVKPLTFKSTAIQPACSTDKGGILITATGGTSPYFYILDDETEVIDGKTVAKKIPFTSPHPIKNLSDGDHKVIVVDSNNCIEK